MNEPTIEDIAAMRADGSLRDYFTYLAAQAARPAESSKPVLAAVPDPGYRIAHTGGWPLGTAATDPTPPPGTCTCAKCGGNTARPPIHRAHEREAA
ncbi:hypothetical protein ACIRU8_39135 [Streptomyces sp. NPDC101175]|uniref:hypothetical protein n=1 Tax=Streptomyces sp. NPDC101175 TaxID=3366123 RepID=UPI0038326FF3